MHTTTTVRLFVDEKGQPLVQSWMEWEATSELRLFTEYPQKPPRLQQHCIRRSIDSAGAVSGGQMEWRDVPLVVIPPPVVTGQERQ